MPPKIHVVAGILFNEHGEFLLSSRPEGKPYAGYWEFAGGKVEAGETEFAALQREFMEELGIEIIHATPWLAKFYRYEHAHVSLRFFRVAAHEWRGKLQAREQQQWAWQKAGDFTVSPMLPANTALLASLAVPTAFSGSLKTGLQGENALGAYRVVPHTMAEIPHEAMWLPLDDWLQANRQPENEPGAFRQSPNARRVWLTVDNVAQFHAAQDADAIIWRVNDNAMAQALAEVLREGAAMPIVAAASADVVACWQDAWRANGAQAVVCDNEIGTA